MSHLERHQDQRHSSRAMRTISASTKSAPTRVCFIVEGRYENDVMPGAVADVLTAWGHEVDVLRPLGGATDVDDLDPFNGPRYDAYVLKTVSGGPGLSILEAAAATGAATVNDARAIRLARDKAVAASRVRAAGLPFPRTWFAARSALLEGLPREAYPLVVKPNNGSSCEQVLRVDRPEDLAALEIDDSGYLLAQPYLPNPGYDVKLYNTGDDVFATVKRSPLHPGAPVVEELIPTSPELKALALAVGRAFGLDIYGIDVIDTPQGWMVLDVNDFPSFGNVPHAAERLARTVLRLARQAVARRVTAETRTLHVLPALEASA